MYYRIIHREWNVNMCTLVCTQRRPNTTTSDQRPAHGEHTLATFVQLPSGSWRAQIRRKGRYISETFRFRKDAEEWALANESRIDRGEKPSASNRIDPTTFGHLIDLHLADMKEVGKCPRRSKAFSLDALNKKLGKVRIADLDRERLVTFGSDRAREGAGPATRGGGSRHRYLC